MNKDAKYTVGAMFVATALSAMIWWLAADRRGDVLILGTFMLAYSLASRDRRSVESRLSSVFDWIFRRPAWTHYTLVLVAILIACVGIGSIVAVASHFLPTWAEFVLAMLLFFSSFPVLFWRIDEKHEKRGDYRR